jgi:hypothetical protein
LDIPGAHELWAVEPAGQYWVALHASLTSGVAHWKPPGHVEAAVVFSGQYCVALQGRMEPGLMQIEPAGQGSGAAEPLRHRLPWAHTTGEIAPVTQYEPAGQVEHAESPDVCANEPA